jgi:hypothetical protein
MLSHAAISGRQSSLAGAQQLQSVLGFAQPAANKDRVTGLSAGAEDASSAFALSDNRYIDKDFVPPGSVSAGDRAPKGSGSFCQAGQKAFQPAACSGRREGKTQEKAAWHAAHGGDIANGAGQGFPADRL